MRPLEFAEPETLSEATALLAERAGEARLLAGGQSLLPMMSAGLVSPGLLVSLGRIPELRRITWEDGGGVRIGAMVTQRALERSPALRQRCPVLAYAASRIASPHVRNLGTLGGNLAHNLVGSDPPAVLIALDARVVIVSRRGERVLPVERLFTGFMETAIQPDEILSEIQIPAPGWSAAVYLKHCVRDVDPALVGIAVAAADGGGSWSAVRIGVSGVGEIPMRLEKTEAALLGGKLDERGIKEAALVAMEEVDPLTDAHGSAEYRRKMTGVMLGRAVKQAMAREAR